MFCFRFRFMMFFPVLHLFAKTPWISLQMILFFFFYWAAQFLQVCPFSEYSEQISYDFGLNGITFHAGKCWDELFLFYIVVWNSEEKG